VVLIDYAVHREDNPVRKPRAYFRSMLRKAEREDLHLHKSIFGILKRGRGALLYGTIRYAALTGCLFSNKKVVMTLDNIILYYAVRYDTFSDEAEGAPHER
jgi:hypothetical protein